MAYLATASAPQRRQAVESFGTVEPICEAIMPGCGLFVVSRGQWSMIDLVLALARQYGGASLSLWTWTVAEGAKALCVPLLHEPALSAARLILHVGALKANAELVAEWQGRYGACAVSAVATHAKIARVLCADGLRVLIRGSMSLNFTPRIEQCDITEGGEDYAMIERVEASLPVVPVNEQVITGLFGQQALSTFRVGKVWAK